MAMLLLLLLLICVVLVASAAPREFGLLFHDNDSFVQAKYGVLCDESVVKLSVYFNTSSGVVLLAENEMARSSLVVYFQRPGIYVNATLGTKLFNLPFMMDFFNNEWIGWHEIEIRLGLKRLALVFDGDVREGVFENRFLFPGSTVENNLILFGIFFKNPEISIPSFRGLMRNIQFKSCSCDQWKPVDIVLTKGISFAHLGECSRVSACPKGCSCVLLDSGQRQCDCDGLHCPKPDDQVFYGFDVKEHQSSGARHQLSVVSRSGHLEYNVGIFEQAFNMSKSQFIDLTASEGRTCFRNIFLCESEFFYQFWLRPSVPNDTQSVTHVLKHSSSITSIYGLELKRIRSEFQVTLSLDYNRRFQLNFSIPLLVWNRISVSFNQTHLKLYLNADLIKSTDVSRTFPEEKSKVVNTRFLFVGDLQGNPLVEIDHFYFSTNENILASPSIQSLRIKRRKEDQTKVADKCNLTLTGGLVNLTDCYRDHFKKSNYSLGFYASLIVHTRPWTRSSLLLETSMFGLSLTRHDLIEIKMENSLSREIRLRPTLNTLVFLEISITSDHRMVIYQDIDSRLDTMYVDMAILLGGSDRFQIAANINEMVVEELNILNMDKDVGIRARRVQTSQVPHYSVDFDSALPDQYPTAKIDKGYFSKGMQLETNKGFAMLNTFNGSCVTNVRLCLNGLTISFWFKLIGSVSTSRNKMVQLFFSGAGGIALALDDGDNFILTVTRSSSIRYFRKNEIIPKNTWHLLELSISGQISLFIDGVEWQSQATTALGMPGSETWFYLGDKGFSGDSVIFLDEINIFEAERNFLYANHFLSTEISRYKLYSFTNYDSTTNLRLDGGSKLVPTRYGQGVLFKGLESGVAISRITDEVNCLSKIDECRRGFTIRLLLRIDSLDIPHQIILSNPQFTVGSNLGTLFVKVSSSNKSWSFTSSVIERRSSWQTLEISWRMSTGLKVFFNGELVGHTVHGTEESLKGPPSNSLLYFGRNQFGESTDSSNVLIDDLELFEADKNSQACQRPFVPKTSCRFQHTFDERDEMKVDHHLGVVGNAGLFASNVTSLRTFIVPPCFEDLTVRCKDCLSLRLWLYLNRLTTEILKANHLKISISQNTFIIEVQNESAEKCAKFSCFYFITDLVKRWHFLEFSWDADEGLLVFVNRDLLLCKQLPNNTVPQQTVIGIDISDAFEGSIDELELYKSRLSVIYLDEVVDEMGIDILLHSVKERQQQQRELSISALSSLQGSQNVTHKRIVSYRFNGQNYLEYTVSGSRDLVVPGTKEEIELSFKCQDTNANSVLWVTEAKGLKNILLLKSRKLFFVTMYTGTSNNSKPVTVEKEISSNIQPDSVYNVLISQKSLEILIKVTSLSNSSLLSLIGKENLLPIYSKVFVGGYKDRNKSKIAGTDSFFTGVVYKESKNVWLEYHSAWNTTGHKIKMGEVVRINNLMLVRSSTELNFLFNSKEGHFRPLQSTPGSLQRWKRSIGNSDNSKIYPRIIIGSDQNMKQTFIGLIAGVKWNNEDVLNKRNIVMKGKSLLTVDKLTVKPFPKPSSYLIIPSSDKHTLVTLLIVMAGILCLIIGFYIIRKVRSRNVPENLYVPVENDSGKLTQNNVDEPIKYDCRVSIQSDKILATLVPLVASAPMDYTDSQYRSSKLVLIRDVNSLQSLPVIDMLIVPNQSHIALVIKEHVNFPIFQNLFPLDVKDEQYSCKSIKISADHHYAFAHMNSVTVARDDVVELQVWEIRDTWHLICRPPNICFTSSIAIPGSPSCLLAVDQQSQTFSIWNFEVSNVIWQLTLNDASSLPFHSMAVSLNMGHIFINHRSKFQILSSSSDEHSSQMSDQDYPFLTECHQVCYIHNNIFLIRTEGQQIYLFNTEDYSFNRKSELNGIVLVATVEYQNVMHVALATNTGEVYVTTDIEASEYVFLGPGNKTQIVCAQFAPDASLFCTGYENNVIHVWKIATDIQLCHFHAIHDSIPLRQLQFTSDTRFIIATLRKGIEDDCEENILSLINRN